MYKRMQRVIWIALIGVICSGCGADVIRRPISHPQEQGQVGSSEQTPAERSAPKETESAAAAESEPALAAETAATEDAAAGAVPELVEAEIGSADALTESAEEDPYAKVLDFYYYGIQDQWQDYKDEEDEETGMGNISFLFTSPYTMVRSTADAGYMQIDLDGDGSDELIVSPMNVAELGLIYDLYTCKDGILYHLAYSGERYAYSLCEDLNIVFYGSNGAAQSINYCYEMREGKLHVVEAVNTDFLRDEENPWFYGSDETLSQEVLLSCDCGELTPITEEEAEQYMDAWKKARRLELCSFAEYIPNSKQPVYSLIADTVPEADVYEMTRQEMETLQALHDKIADSLENDDLNQMEYNQLNEDLYEMWDKELNVIWKRLKPLLDPEVMEALTLEEKDWIKDKELEMQKAGAEYEGGSMQPMIIYGVGSEMTRERVYELIERYLQ